MPAYSEAIHRNVAAKSLSPLQELRRRRLWILAILLFCNLSAVIKSTFQVLSWPSSVKLSLTDGQVKAFHDTDGTASYVATVPVKEFPFNLQLQQGLRFDALIFIFVNLLLLLGLTHVFWRESRLLGDHTFETKKRTDGGGPEAKPD
jgi:hypothetical protein